MARPSLIDGAACCAALKEIDMAGKNKHLEPTHRRAIRIRLPTGANASRKYLATFRKAREFAWSIVSSAYQMQELFAALLDKHGHTFAEEVLTKPAEDGKGPDGHGWAYSFAERFAVFRECLDRSYGRAPQAIQVDQASTQLTKVIHEIRWLPPDPNDRSVEAVPEP